MDSNAPRCVAFIEMRRDCFSDVLLQVLEVLTLRRDAPAIGIIPPRHEPARFLIALDLKRDLFP